MLISMTFTLTLKTFEGMVLLVFSLRFFLLCLSFPPKLVTHRVSYMHLLMHSHTNVLAHSLNIGFCLSIDL